LEKVHKKANNESELKTLKEKVASKYEISVDTIDLDEDEGEKKSSFEFEKLVNLKAIQKMDRKGIDWMKIIDGNKKGMTTNQQ